jgi:hypothetical protein
MMGSAIGTRPSRSIPDEIQPAEPRQAWLQDPVLAVQLRSAFASSHPSDWARPSALSCLIEISNQIIGILDAEGRHASCPVGRPKGSTMRIMDRIERYRVAEKCGAVTEEIVDAWIEHGAKGDRDDNGCTGNADEIPLATSPIATL